MEKINNALSGFAPNIGAEAGPGTHGGNDVEKPEGMPDRRDADYSVTTPRELDNALSDDNAIVYVAEDIDLAEWDTIWAGDGVSLLGDYCNPDVRGPGAAIRHRRTDDDVYTRKCIRHRGGKPLQLYGVYAHGPRTDYFDPDHNAPEFHDLTSSFVHEHAPASSGKFKALGCRLTGWTMAGIEFGARRYDTRGVVRYSTLDRNRMWHLGYGIEQYAGDLWIDRCYFDACRHAIAGFGRPTEQTDVTNCVFGPGYRNSHDVDQHRLGENVSNDSHTAGGHLRVRNCTFLGRHGNRGSGEYEQENIAIRGTSVDESQVYNCEFPHPEEPDPPGRQGSAVRQVVFNDENEWQNLRLWNNTYGRIGDVAGVGAPRARKAHEDDDEPIEDDPSGTPGQPEPTMQRLKIRGHGGPGVEGDYSIIIHGEVAGQEDTEKSEQVEDLDGERKRITGNMWGGADVFLLADDALPVRAELETPCSIWLDENNITGALVGVEAYQRFAEQQARLDELREWAGGLADNLRSIGGFR